MNENKILNLFFMNPMQKFGVRELSRKAKLDTKTVMKYLKRLVRDQIILKKKEKNKYAYYESNRHSKLYRYVKSETLIKKIVSSQLIEFLEEKVQPQAIVLFGSVSTGTYYKDSDIDLFIQADYQKIDLTKFDKTLNHRITLFFEKDISKLSKGLLTNIYNGVVLSGKLEIFKWKEKNLKTV